MPGIVDDYLEGKLKVKEFITDRFDLDHINDAFDAMHKGDCIRAVVKNVTIFQAMMWNLYIYMY